MLLALNGESLGCTIRSNEKHVVVAKNHKENFFHVSFVNSIMRNMGSKMNNYTVCMSKQLTEAKLQKTFTLLHMNV